VIVFAVCLAIIQYVDKVCISQTAPFIQKDLHLNKDQMGWVFGVFTLAYALFEIPAGYLGDRFGPRPVLLRIVIQMCDMEMGRLLVTHHKTPPAAATSTKMPSAEVDWLSPGRPLLDGCG
jgi:MFS family permease